MFRLETTRTTGKDNFLEVRGLTRSRFFYVGATSSFSF